MAEQLNSIIPNVMEKLPEFLTSIKETFIMVGWSGIDNNSDQAGQYNVKSCCLSRY